MDLVKAIKNKQKNVNHIREYINKNSTRKFHLQSIPSTIILEAYFHFIFSPRFMHLLLVQSSNLKVIKGMVILQLVTRYHIR